MSTNSNSRGLVAISSRSVTTADHAYSIGTYVQCYVPVLAGKNFTVIYENATLSIFRFIYAQGSDQDQTASHNTAPANGWYQLRAVVGSTPGYVELTNSSIGLDFRTMGDHTGTCAFFIPVKKGDVVTYWSYDVVQVDWFSFLYAGDEQ